MRENMLFQLMQKSFPRCDRYSVSIHFRIVIAHDYDAIE